MRTIIALLLSAACAPAQQAPSDTQFWAEARELQREVNALWKAKDYAAMIRRLEAFDSRPDVRRENEMHHGNLFTVAAGHCRLGNTAKAGAILRELASIGFQDFKRVEADACLSTLRGQPEFDASVQRIRASAGFWSDAAFRSGYRPDLGAGEKVAGLSKFWSEAKFNFAWFEKLPPGFDWDAQYVAYLPKVLETRSTAEYYRVLKQFAALLRDGHSSVSPPKELADQPSARPLLRLRYVEGHVLAVPEDGQLQKEGIAAGVEIVAVDGIPVRKYAEERIFPFEQASTLQELEIQAFERRLLSGPADSAVRLTFRAPDGGTFERSLPRLPARARAVQGKPAFEFRMLEGNVAYVILNSFANSAVSDEFERRFDEIAKSDKLIFDVRENGGGNSAYSSRILGHLIREPYSTLEWRGRVYQPADRAWGKAQGWRGGTQTAHPRGPQYYGKPVVVLTGPRTFSAAENFVAEFDLMKRGKIVGEPTGGSTGNPLIFALPGGGSGRVCTRQVFYPDGRPFVGQGIQPDILVPSTVADFRSGRDAVLERALEYLLR